VKNFVKALEIFQLVAAIAEEEGPFFSSHYLFSLFLRPINSQPFILLKFTTMEMNCRDGIKLNSYFSLSTTANGFALGVCFLF